MTLKEAMQHFSTGYQLCKRLKITSTNYYRWRQNGFIPLKQQFLINRVLGTDLPIDFDKESMEKRIGIN